MADNKTNYDDNVQADSDLQATTHLQTNTIQADGTEPATGHDVKEGGIMGAVGGAVVGMLAGGPIGAVIGAIAGGAASAAAVNVVDKHDHDYARTVDNNSTAVSEPISNYSPTGISSTDMQTDTSSPASHTADTVATTTSYGSTLAQNPDGLREDQEAVIPIVEESLEVGKRQVQSGGAHIHTSVIETPVEETLHLREEHVSVNRHAVNEPVSDAAMAFQERTFEMTETAEVPVISKQARVVEEIVIGKTATDRIETVHDTVRRTEVNVEELDTDAKTHR